MFTGQYVLLWNIFFFNCSIIICLNGLDIKETVENEFPFIIGITRRVKNFIPERDLICTGAIFSKQYALTAEHCVRVQTLTGIQIILQSINASVEIRYPAWWLTFEQWSDIKFTHNRFLQNDICIIRLIEDMPEEFPFANLSFIPHEQLANENVRVVGWGDSYDGSSIKRLQIINLKILSKKDCEMSISKLDEQNLHLDGNLLCTAQDPLALLMRGDSGGPLLYNNNIVGVNMGTCPLPQDLFNADKVNLHTNILYYQRYFTDVINNF